MCSAKTTQQPVNVIRCMSIANAERLPAPAPGDVSTNSPNDFAQLTSAMNSLQLDMNKISSALHSVIATSQLSLLCCSDNDDTNGDTNGDSTCSGGSNGSFNAHMNALQDFCQGRRQKK